MALPLLYNLRSVRVRWRVTLLAVLGIALVVAVCAVLMATAEGFATALRSTGRSDNAIVVQRGSPSELMSHVPLEERNAILVDERVARGADGQALASWERVPVLSLRRKSDGRRTNVLLRAVPPAAFQMRGEIRLTSGRRLTPGLAELIVGRRIQNRVRGVGLGSKLRYGGVDFRIVGVFESAGAAFESEVWGDFDTLSGLFHSAPGSNSLVVRMRDASQIPALDRWLKTRPQMQLRAVSERQYYVAQGQATGASNLQSLSEVAFAFRVTPGIVAAGLLFALAMGVLGGLLPALRAARLPIATAVRVG